jgi:hypothetical protein
VQGAGCGAEGGRARKRRTVSLREEVYQNIEQMRIVDLLRDARRVAMEVFFLVGYLSVSFSISVSQM